MQSVNLPGMGNEFGPLLAGGSIDNVSGLVLNFDQQTLSTGLVGGLTRTLGSVRFHVVKPTGTQADIDVFASLQNPGIDDLNGPSGSVGGNFIGASVTGCRKRSSAAWRNGRPGSSPGRPPA